MKLDAPIGNALYAPLLIRVPLGAYLVLNGMQESKIALAARIAQIKELHLMPEVLATIYGALFPYVDLVAGAMIAGGFLTTLAAMVMSVMLMPLVLKAGLNHHAFLNHGALLLGASLSLLYSGPGALSVDRFRKGGG